ncbi:MAG TPA: hypothetical protein VMW23_06390 [Sedimentisphaerales bacterium]|nr:hypothetical protein [Sedimentisphaerales bacterium]
MSETSAGARDVLAAGVCGEWTVVQAVSAGADVPCETFVPEKGVAGRC